MQRLVVRDETASGIITWFNQPYLKDKFVVGYGLDYNQNYRNLPYIGYVESEDEF